jgi:Mrp family chromosome partitioning ATPase
MLRTNLEVAGAGSTYKTIMFASAQTGGGNSTTLANLAFAFSRAGRDVAIVDLDVRRPMLHRFLNLKPAPGLADVALGHARLDDALWQLSVANRGTARTAATNGSGRGTGAVHALTLGAPPPEDGFIASEAVAEILSQLKERFGVVLVDSPPLFSVGDALALTAIVDGVVLVVRRNVIRGSVLSDVQDVLGSARATVLGAVLTDAEVSGPAHYHIANLAQRKDDARLRVSG